MAAVMEGGGGAGQVQPIWKTDHLKQHQSLKYRARDTTIPDGKTHDRKKNREKLSHAAF